MKCSKHPKQKINKKPKHQCEVCLSNYFKYGKKRSPVIKNERNIAFDVKSQLPEGFVPFDSAIHVKRLLYVFPPQKNWSKKKLKELEEGKIIYKETKPDLTDNLNKGLFDAMNGIVFTDDSRICKMSDVEKIYGFVPRIEVEFEKLN